MKKILLLVTLFNTTAFAQESYRYDSQVRASDFARGVFGSPGTFNRSPGVDVGNFSAQVYSELDCGKLDIKANFNGEFNKLQEQLRKLVPKPNEIPDFIARSAMITMCYAYPVQCAQLRADWLNIQGNLNLRAKACEAIDKFIDNQADKGAKQLRAEAQHECVAKEMAKDTKISMVDATEICQNRTGLALRDFSRALEREFTDKKQKVLQNIVGFAREPAAYTFLASVLGEIEVQQNGYWQPLFENRMLRPHDVAENFLAEGQEFVCTRFENILAGRPGNVSGTAERSVVDVISKRLTSEDLSNLKDLGTQDQKLACAALGRAVGQVAADKAIAKNEAVLASGLLNTAIPNGLRDEYRGRGQSAFQAIKKTLESEQIPSIEYVRQAISNLASATRQRNRILASKISSGKISNSRQETQSRSDCTDTTNCERN